MGLDVYLCYSIDREAERAAEKKYDDACNAFWKEIGGYDKATAEQKAEVKVKELALAAELGLTWYLLNGGHKSAIRISNPSAKYPDHMFKIGYFRSSYNDSGLNSYLKRMGVFDLYDIFEPSNDYEATPNWAAAMVNVKMAIGSYEAHRQSDAGGIDILEIPANPFTPKDEYPKSSNEVLKLVTKQIKDRKGALPDTWMSFSNREGHYFLGGLTMIAAIPGICRFGTPCTYIAYRQTDKDGVDWYVQALEIVQETIEFVLAHPDPENYYFRWSS